MAEWEEAKARVLAVEPSAFVGSDISGKVLIKREPTGYLSDLKPTEQEAWVEADSKLNADKWDSSAIYNTHRPYFMKAVGTNIQQCPRCGNSTDACYYFRCYPVPSSEELVADAPAMRVLLEQLLTQCGYSVPPEARGRVPSEVCDQIRQLIFKQAARTGH
jgi:hypothetical protein